jgi:hypothetical protein
MVTTAVAVAIAGDAVRGADPTVVDAVLSVSGDLPDASRRVLVHEVESIWRQAGVEIRWVEETHRDGAALPLRVHVVRGAGPPPRRRNWVVGELLRFTDGAAVAVASITRAEEIVRAAGAGRASSSPESVVDHRVGVVLGRAVAHEIGHYLLENRAHATYGLMRPTFQPGEFTDLRSGTFEVDAESRRRVLDRLAAAAELTRHAGTPIDLTSSGVE